MKELQNKILDYLYLLAATFFFSVNLIWGLRKSLWLDEVGTLITINSNSFIKLIQNIYNGSDQNAHAPLYFILMYFLNLLFGEQVLIFKTFSFSCIIVCILIAIYVLKDKIKYQTFLFLFLFLSINSFFSQFLIVEIRMYGLYFGLVIFWILYLYINRERNYLDVKSLIIYALLLTALLYIHYYSFFYIFLLFLLEIYYSLKYKFFRNLIPYLISFFLFSPWIVAIKNQVDSVHGYFWQKIPSLDNFFDLYYSFVGKSSLFLLVFILIYFMLKNKNLGSIKIFSEDKSLFIISLFSFLIVPFFIFITSLFELTVFVNRYFIPTYIVLILFLGILFQVSKLYKKSYLRFFIFLFLIVVGIYRMNNYRQFVQSAKEELNKKLELNEFKIPIVCESPHTYYPLEYYSQKKGVSNFYFILDYESTFKEGNIKNAPLDYFWNLNLKKCYDLPRVIEWDDFKAQNNKFLLIDEEDRMLFENRIEINPKYSWQVVKDNIYFVDKK